MTAPHNVIACASCPGAIGPALRRTFAEAGMPGFAVSETDCMSGCARGPTLAFRAPGKTAYLFGEITAANLPEILVFARLYAAARDGVIADARPLGRLRLQLIARIPGAA